MSKSAFKLVHTLALYEHRYQTPRGPIDFAIESTADAGKPEITAYVIDQRDDADADSVHAEKIGDTFSTLLEAELACSIKLAELLRDPTAAEVAL